MWEGIKSVWNNIVSWFSDKITALTEWFDSLGETFTDIGSNILNWVFDGLKNTWKSISSWVSDKVDWLTDKLAFWNSSKNKMSSDSSFSRNSDMMDHMLTAYHMCLLMGIQLCSTRANVYLLQERMQLILQT